MCGFLAFFILFQMRKNQVDKKKNGEVSLLGIIVKHGVNVLTLHVQNI